jgi:hypothetical protein
MEISPFSDEHIMLSCLQNLYVEVLVSPFFFFFLILHNKNILRDTFCNGSFLLCSWMHYSSQILNSMCSYLRKTFLCQKNVEGHDEFMLASAFDCLNRDVREARGFLVKNAKLRKFWLDSFSKNHGN